MFSVELPPNHLDFADFVIMKERFLQSRESSFKVADQCKVCSTHLLRQENQVFKIRSYIASPHWQSLFLELCLQYPNLV